MSAPDQPATREPGDRPQMLANGIVTLWRLQSIARWAVVWLLVSTSGALLLPAWRWVPAALAAIGAAVAVTAVPGWRYRRWRWRLTGDALELRHGIVIERHVAVPYFRIQQIDVTRTPLERLLGLATIEVTTASATGTARILGITAMRAPRLRATLIERAHAATAAFEGDSRDAV